MKKLIFILSLCLLSFSNLNAEDVTYVKKCKPCTEADIAGTVSGMGIGGGVAYAACVSAAIAAGTLTAGAGFVAGMAVCGGATVAGAVTGGEAGHLVGDTIDDYRDCCE